MKAIALAATIAAAPAIASAGIVEDQIAWIAENSDLSYNGEPLPTFERVDSDYMQILFYGEQAVAKAEMEGYELDEILAFYNHETDTIVTPTDVDPEAWENQHKLLHELVHYMQDINGGMPECLPNSEPLAYSLQEQWQDENDHPAKRPNKLFVLLLGTVCDDPFGVGR